MLNFLLHDRAKLAQRFGNTALVINWSPESIGISPPL